MDKASESHLLVHSQVLALAGHGLGLKPETGTPSRTPHGQQDPSYFRHHHYLSWSALVQMESGSRHGNQTQGPRCGCLNHSAECLF